MWLSLRWLAYDTLCKNLQPITVFVSVAKFEGVASVIWPKVGELAARVGTSRMFDWKTFLALIFEPAAVVLMIGWLGHRFIDHLFTRDNERRKADDARRLAEFASELERESDHRKAADSLRLTDFASQLERIATEQATTYAIMHSRRANIIARVYAGFVAVERKGSAFLSWKGGPEELKPLMEAAYAELRELRDYFEPNRIYLTQAINDKVQELFTVMHHPLFAASYRVDFPSKFEDDRREDRKEIRAEWGKFYDGTETLRPKLDAELRRIIGADSDTPRIAQLPP